MNSHRILITALLCLLAAAPALATDTKNVIFVNPPDQPVPTQATGITSVQNVNEPALQPFQVRLTINVAPGDNGANVFLDVPAGKRLVIEYASAYGDAPAGQVLTFSVGTMIPGETNFTEHDLPATQQDAVGNTDMIFIYDLHRRFGGPAVCRFTAINAARGPHRIDGHCLRFDIDFRVSRELAAIMVV